MKNIFSFRVLSLLLAVVLVISFAACSDDDSDSNPGPDTDPHSQATIQKANLNILDYTYDGYLWDDKLPSRSNFDITKESNPIDFFENKLRYTELDVWSYVTDKAQALFDGYEGEGTTYGYSLMRGRFNNTNNYFAIVNYVYPNSPAEKAGITRGDIILLMNGQDITEDNYMDLLYSSSITLQMGEIKGEYIELSDKKASMNAITMELDAVNTYKVVEKGNKKIGYICYTDFVRKSESRLTQAFTDLKSQGVTDIVLDLRYNLGGADLTAQHLASILVPEAMIGSKENYFLKELWNEDYMAYFASNGQDKNMYFINAGVNMGLQQGAKLYVLTSGNTASASEAVIAGLKPYLDVVTIGKATHGKYCGAALIRFGTDGDGKVTDEALSDWALSLIVLKFVNRDGLTEFKGGIPPDYDLAENWQNLLPLGDENDPLFAKAIELITGETVNKKQAIRTLSASSYQLLDDEKRMSPLKGGMNKIVKGAFN